MPPPKLPPSSMSLRRSTRQKSSQTATTPTSTASVPSIPQKRPLQDEEHQPAVSSPLNPDFKTATTAANAPARDDATPSIRDRAPRTKKESLKKREGGDGRNTPDVKPPKASGGGGGGGGGGKRKVAKEVITPQRYQLPRVKLQDFDISHAAVLTPTHVKIGPDGEEIQFCETGEHVYNKKLFSYVPCIADPAFPMSNHFRKTEVFPLEPALCIENTSSNMFLDSTAHHITTDKGFRMAKGNVCARFGRYYWECKITSGIPKRRKSESQPEEEPRGHVRMGWARREATLDGPVGYDAYSYGLRDRGGQKVFMSRPKDFFPPGEDIREGDVIGLEINLPSETLHKKVIEGHYNPAVDLQDDENPSLEASDFIRDRLAIRFKALYFEAVEYHSSKELEELMNPSPVIASTGGVSGSSEEPHPNHPLPALRTLPHSNITIYKNGKLMGTPFKDLLAFLPLASKPPADKTSIQVGGREGIDDGMLGYYPAVSVFRGGAAEVNFGPKFWYPPPGYEQDIREEEGNQSKEKKLKPVSERFDEQIVEDIVYDVIDEVDFWIQDGMPDTSVGGYKRNVNGLGMRGDGMAGENE